VLNNLAAILSPILSLPHSLTWGRVREGAQGSENSTRTYSTLTLKGNGPPLGSAAGALEHIDANIVQPACASNCAIEKEDSESIEHVAGIHPRHHPRARSKSRGY
jgi:hypothetical protein